MIAFKAKLLQFVEIIKFIYSGRKWACVIEPSLLGLAVALISIAWLPLTRFHPMILVYSGILLLLIIEIRRILIFPAAMNVVLVLRMVLPWLQRKENQNVWFNEGESQQSPALNDNMWQLKLMLLYWLILLTVNISIFSAAYNLEDDLRTKKHTYIQIITDEKLDKIKESLNGAFSGIYKSVMIQFLVGVALDKTHDLNHRNVLAVLQIVSTLLLFTIALLLIQQRVAKDIDPNETQNYILAYMKLTNRQAEIRGCLSFLGRFLFEKIGQSENSENPICQPIWRRALAHDKLEHIEGLLNAFLSQPELLFLIHQSLREEVEEFVKEKSALVERNKHWTPECKRAVLDKFDNLKCHLNILAT